MVASSNLEFFFKPSGCAVIGASNDDKKAGKQIIENMIASGFLSQKEGTALYPVNSREEGSIHGLKFYKSVSEIDGSVELVILAVSSNRIKDVIRDIKNRMDNRNDIRAIITVAAGFAETGTDDGKEKQKLLLQCCNKYNIRLIGPNCVGIIDNANYLDSTFILGTGRKKGGISLISQSGAIGSWMLMDWASQKPETGFNKFISLGNMADADTLEFLEYLEKDKETKAIGIYMEGYPNARELMHVANRVSKEKPVLALKVGRTELGSRAAQSHTGSMAGSDKIYDAAFKQFGILRIDSMEEFSDSLRAFDTMPLPKSNRVFVITQAGGPGIYCVDSMGNFKDFEFADISGEAKEKLKDILPPFASICHPKGHIDVTAAASAEQHRKAVEIVLEEENVDALILITVPTLFVPAKDIGNSLKDGILSLRQKGIDKPFLPVILSGDAVLDGRKILEENKISTFATPDRAVKALRQLILYSRHLKEGTL